MKIVKASQLMNEADAKRMAELKAEYCKLTTRITRKNEIYAEMVTLRNRVAVKYNLA